MAELTAGSVSVDIGGNIAPFEAALAKARQMAEAFDRQLSARMSSSAALSKIAVSVEKIDATLAKLTAKLGDGNAAFTKTATSSEAMSAGLAEVTAASDKAAASLAEVTTGARTAEAALSGATAATASTGITASVDGLQAATVSAREFSRALEMTGGDLAKITPGMISLSEAEKAAAATGEAAGASIAEVGAAAKATVADLSAMTAASREARAAVSGMSDATVGTVAQNGLRAATISAKDFAKALEMTGGDLSKVTPSMVGLADAQKTVAAAAANAAAGEDMAAAGLSRVNAAATETAGLTAGVSREFMVLGREALTGNFSRMSGSLVVMANRMQGVEHGAINLKNVLGILGSVGSVIFNPFVLGTVVLGTVISETFRLWGSFTGSEADSSKKSLSDFDELLKDIKASSSDAAEAIRQVAKAPESIDVNLAKIKLSSNELEASLKQQFDKLSDIGPQAIPLLGLGAGNYQAYQSLLNLVDEASKGQITVAKMRDELGKVIVNPQTPKSIADIAAKLFNGSVTARQLQAELNGLKAPSLVNLDALKSAETDMKAFLSDFEKLKSLAPDLRNAQQKAQDAFNAAMGSNDAILREQAKEQYQTTLDALKAQQTLQQFSKVSSGDLTGGIFGDTSKLTATLSDLKTAQSDFISLKSTSDALKTSYLQQAAALQTVVSKVDELTAERNKTQDMLNNLAAPKGAADLLGSTSDITAESHAISFARSQVEGLVNTYLGGKGTVKEFNDGLANIKQNLIAMGYDADKVNALIDKISTAEIKTAGLNAEIIKLHKNLNDLPNSKTISIGIKQYTVPNGSGGTSSVTVDTGGYGGSGDLSGSAGSVGSGAVADVAGSSMSYQSYDVGGSSPVGVYYAVGGIVTGPGGPTDDKVLAHLSNGEFVMNADATKKYRGVLEVMNEGNIQIPGFAAGGAVSGNAASLLSGYHDSSSQMEDDLYGILNEAKAHTQFFSTFESDFKQMVDLLGGISTASSVGASTGGATGTVNLSQSTLDAINAGLGVMGQTSNGTPIYNYTTPGSPYFNSGFSGVPYDPVADYTLNHNPAALAQTGAVSGALYQQYGYAPSSVTAQDIYAAKKQSMIQGFATGGMIMPGEDQKVELFKKTSERVIVVDDSKVMDARDGSSGSSSASGAADKSPHVTIGTVVLQLPASAMQGNSRQALQAQADIFAKSVKQALARG